MTEETKEAANQTVGKLQSQRFHAAAKLSSAERELIIRFLDDMTEQLALPEGGWNQELE